MILHYQGVVTISDDQILIGDDDLVPDLMDKAGSLSSSWVNVILNGDDNFLGYFLDLACPGGCPDDILRFRVGDHDVLNELKHYHGKHISLFVVCAGGLQAIKEMIKE